MLQPDRHTHPTGLRSGPAFSGSDTGGSLRSVRGGAEASASPKLSRRMSERRALITGITGQDGSYLAELLLAKGYKVHGMVRRSSTETFQRLAGIRDSITLHTGDLLDQRSLVDVMRESEPQEIYNLAAMSFVAASWNQPVLTAEFTGTGVTRMLEAMRDVAPDARFYQASSSEMFGKVLEVPQRESTPSTRAPRTAWPSATATSSRSTTASRTTCLPAQGYFSTTNPSAGASSSSPAR